MQHRTDGQRCKLRLFLIASIIAFIQVSASAQPVTMPATLPSTAPSWFSLKEYVYQEAEVDFVADNPGLTLFHCHQQLHMDYGFMTLFDYV